MAGTSGSVSTAAPDREFEILCDDDGAGNVTAFLRRYTVDVSGAVVPVDTQLDGTTPYTAAGTVGRCEQPPVPQRPVAVHGVQNTDWSLAANAGTQSVTLMVLGGSVTVTTTEGTITAPAGATLTWSVDGDGIDSELTSTLSIDGTAPAASWLVLWTSQA
ncbi:hypothetical protein [Streptomyces carpinensis]|uniref:Uncharacterized protein n=1 Tax=Streptomyces carpinensis TaxID=66369 RepID=A0ABV1VW80_9ACTN|nr:hypothetical protein [Streptomyces carpinensis]